MTVTVVEEKISGGMFKVWVVGNIITSDLFCSTVCFKFEGQANEESGITRKLASGGDVVRCCVVAEV